MSRMILLDRLRIEWPAAECRGSTGSRHDGGDRGRERLQAGTGRVRVRFRRGVDRCFDARLDFPELLQHVLAQEGAGVDTIRHRRRCVFGKGSELGHEWAELRGVGGKVAGLDERLDLGLLPVLRSHAATPTTIGATTTLPPKRTSTGTFANAARRMARTPLDRLPGCAAWYSVFTQIPILIARQGNPPAAFAILRMAMRKWWDSSRLSFKASDLGRRRALGSGVDRGHPPCSRWCRLAGLVEARWGHKRGDDGGCFAAALRSVRTFGGVLEHPAYSDAWAAFDLPVPPTGGGWVRGICGGWSCYVEQGRYGHPAKKATWLYAYGARFLPGLEWGSAPDFALKALVSWCGNHVKSRESRRRVGKREASMTPERFRDILIEIARNCAIGKTTERD